VWLKIKNVKKMKNEFGGKAYCYESKNLLKLKDWIMGTLRQR
jgi:hypothetical protein